MAIRWAIANGDNNQTSTWNDGATLGLPTSADDVFTNGFTVNMAANATYISMNNTARLRDVVTATMTSNNAPSPNVVFSSAGATPWLAYDRSFSTSTGWQSGANTLPAFIVYDFGLGNTRVVDGYTIYTFTSGNGQPRTWTLDGSNDNINWTQLNSQNLPSAIAAGSSFTVASIGNTNAYRYYRIRVTQTGGSTGVDIAEIDLYASGTASITSGGSFNFNTAGVTVTCTSTSASLGVASGTTFSTITATTGTVTLNTASNLVYNPGLVTLVVNHSGACNFVFSGVNITAANIGVGTLIRPIDKTSSGTLTINANITTLTNSGGGISVLTSSAGNTIINGNVTSGSAGPCISQSAGNVTVTGNVTGGTGANIHGISLTGAASQFTINGNVTGGSGSTAHGINFGGTLGTVNGNVTGGGGSGARGISTDTGGVNVTGNVTGFVGIGLVIGANSTIIGNVFGGSSSAGINTATNNSFTVTVTGDVYASNTQAGIQLTGTGTQVVNLTGNMYNTLGRMAIWCPNVFISNTATTLWRVDTGGGYYKFLYSADTTPNLPAITNVRFGTTYGPALSLTGTMVVLANSDVRKDVPNDNSVGTAELTSADIISGINASSDPLAVRLKNALTDVTAGNIISQYKDS